LIANNPLGVSSNMDKIPLHPYFIYKDYFGIVIFGIVFAFVVFFYPNLLGSLGLGHILTIFITICWKGIKPHLITYSKIREDI
jgi:ubiquinol-cytochrome c reductase cytochrome b subunit